MKIHCAWCAKTMGTRPGGRTRTTHGICLECMGRQGIHPVERIPDLTAVEADALPFGLIQLDRDGAVRTYNAAEARLAGTRPENVIGRNFFREVAPCTAVSEFEGRFRAMVARGSTRWSAFGSSSISQEEGSSYPSP